MATVYTWHATGSTEVDGHSIDGRGLAREPLAEQSTELDGRVVARERSGAARERGEARAAAWERAEVEHSAALDPTDGDGHSSARERMDAEARERGEACAPSAEVPDWSREYCLPLEWNPSRQLLRALRDYKCARERGGPVGLVKRKIAALRHRFWSVMTGAEIPLNSSRIDGGLLIPHPNGIVIHPEVVIGPNCLLFQQVTLGTGPRPGVPKLGGNIDVGPGAKILGGVSIGDHAIIGANAVVLNDVAPGAVVVGVPAMPKKMPARQRDG